MSIQKKSLISTLKTAKKANIASSHETEAKGAKVSSMRMSNTRAVNLKSAKQLNGRAVGSTRTAFKSLKAVE